ncbi:MAG: hypothetical protein IJZ72_05925 [Oscillospiraceae bacterium]|nr:hypothetical protein [Oscillospiraceae bacterium]
MDFFDTEVFGGVLGTLLDMSLIGAVMICAVLVLRLFMKKLPRKYSCILWIIPAIRLLCPMAVASNASLFNLVELPSESGSAYVEEITADVYEAPAVTAVTVYETEETAVSEQVYVPAEVVVKEPERKISLGDVLTAVWLAGFGGMCIYIAFSYGRTHERIKNAEQLQGNVYICKDIESPFVFGIFRPRVFIPEGIGEKDMAYILAHENAHISRGDHIAKLAAMLILAAHWFNPAVWIGFKFMTEDMELSCDEKALGSYDLSEKKAYAQTLLNMSMRQNGIKLGGMLSFGESGIKARIKGVLAMKKPKTIACICAAAVIIIAAVCLLTNAVEPSYKMSGYNSFRLVSDTAERQALPYEEDIGELIKIVDGIKVRRSDFVPEGDSDICIKMYESEDALGEYSALEFYETEQGYFMTLTERAGLTEIFPFETMEYETEEIFSYEISEMDYHAVSGLFHELKHNIFTGVITETAGNIYIVEADGGQWVQGRVFVALDEPAEVGDRVRVCFKGGIMETSPQQIDQVYASVISAADLNEGVYYNNEFSKDAHFVVSGNKMQFFGGKSDFEKMYDMMMPDSDEEMRNEWLKNSMNGWKEPVEFYIGNVNIGYGFETEIIFDEVRDGAGNIVGSVAMHYIDEDTIEYCGVRFFRNGTSAWYDVDRLNLSRPDSFKITETEEGFEARSPETDIYVFFTPDDEDELVLRRNGEEKRIAFIGGFFPDYTYCYVSDITGDSINDLAFFRQWTGTGVVDNEAAIVDGSNMTEIEIDRIAAEIMISEQSKIVDGLTFKNTFPMISATPVQMADKYRYPLYPDKSVVRYGGMMYGLENSVVTGESLFCFMRNESEYSDTFTALFTFKYEGGKLVPDEMSYKANGENDSEFKAVVTETDENGGVYAVKPLEYETELNSSDKIYIDTDLTFKRGQVVKVKYDGRIMETYPAQVEEKSVELVQLTDPYEAVEMYLYAEGIKCEQVRIAQNSRTIAWQYGEDCIEAYADTSEGQKIVIVDLADMTVRNKKVFDYEPNRLTGVVKELGETNDSIQFYTVKFPDREAEVYSIAMYGSYEDGTAEPFKVGDAVEVEFNGDLLYDGMMNHVFSMKKADAEMTRYALEQWIFHRSEHGYDISEDKVQVLISLPSEWSGDANGFDFDGGKIMDVIIVYPASEGIETEEYKTDYALGREITVHEEKFDGDNFVYYIKTSVPEFYSDDGSYDTVKYVVKSGDYYVGISIISDRGIEQSVIDAILNSIEVSVLNGAAVSHNTIEVTAEDFEQVKMSVNYLKESTRLEIFVENGSEYEVITGDTYVSRLVNGEYEPVGFHFQTPQPVETKEIPSGEGVTFYKSLFEMDGFQEGDYKVEIMLSFKGAEDIVYHLNCDFTID